ncbi:MAG: glutamine amidotransferase [Phycisphaerales bacterium]|nr:glutamine amidotransferase [Phycisphaerales bacterium]
MQAPAIIASITVGPVQFDRPVWLLLIPILGVLAWWMGRRSLAGLGPVTRWVALVARLVVICLIAGAMAEPQWRTEAQDVSVTVIVDASESIPASVQKDIDRYVEEVAASGRERPTDRLGLLTIAKDSFVQSLPSDKTDRLERQHVGALDGTNLAAGVRLAMAVVPPDAANRLLIISDGNETSGSVVQTAEAARAQGIPIDVLPLKYNYQSEVLVDRLIAPSTARMGENVALRVVLQATAPTRGLLSILMNGQPVDLDPDSPALGTAVELKAGPNVLSVPIRTREAGAQKFEAFFEPEIGSGGQVIGDAVLQNNRAESITFVSGEGKVLVIREVAEDAAQLVEALTEARIATDVRTAEQMPATLPELASFDAIVLVNEPVDLFSLQQQEDLKQYVNDIGGGLVMVGGPRSFGAGGWIGSPLEDALPIRLDPPQKRQMPRGALALCIHSVEIPEGVYLGKKICESAVNALSRLDLIGINEFRMATGVDWVYPLSEVGDGTAAKRAIQNLEFGDMPDFSPSLELALKSLVAAPAGQKHMIVISDGDPSPPSTQLLQKFVNAKITISAVACATHSFSDQQTMQRMAQYTGGRYYSVDPQNAGVQIPQIFIKEAQTVKRSLIWEGTPFTPSIAAAGSEPMRGITTVPPVAGYVVSADREGLSQVTLRGKENDPILAQWQFGLGRVVTYTSDGATRWNPQWVQWPAYRQFWEQHLRWVMRPSGSANIRLTTETRGDETIVSVEALDPQGERLNFARFQGRVAAPDGSGQDITLRQVGPGRYEGRVRTAAAGSHVLSMRYAAPTTSPDGASQVLEGTVQAAISKPFADEFRSMQDNSALLRQVAELTKGRVMTGDARADKLWARENLTMPVATRPIWMAAALTAIGLFVLDVGVRRVRIDIPAMIRRGRSLLQPGKVKAGEQMAGLQAAREKARKKMAEKAEASRRVEEASSTYEQVKAAASAKFEAPRDAPRFPTQDAGVLGGASARPDSPAPGTQAPGAAQPGQPPGEGMSRLLKAKKKAREEMKDE